MDESQITATTSAGPFVVSSPNAGGQLFGEQSVLWDVAGTDQPPVDVTAVDILLSTNGGYDYPIVLAANTPNDGAESILLPEIYAPNARIMVSACGNVFFDANDADFSIVPTSESSLVVVLETNVFSTNVSVLLPGAGTKGNAGEFPLPLSISGVQGIVEKVTVQLKDLTHSFVDDLDILLVGPGGQNVILLSDASAGAMASRLQISFSDDGLTFPGVGTLASGEYQTVNGGANGDSFPVPGPYGSVLSLFNGLDPNGTWSLYIVDDSSGDAGVLAGGWSLSIETSRVESQINQAPIIASQSIHYVHVGSTLVVTNDAVDPDGGDPLTFALRPDSPTGVVLAADGVLTWAPAASLAGTTNVCGVSVTDAGSPALTAEAEFEVVVASLPVVTLRQLTHDTAQLSWTSIPGGAYRIECTDHLNPGTWVEVGDAVTASGFTVEATCSAVGATQRFFRIRVEH